MRKLEIVTLIAASPERVWAVLTDCGALSRGGLGIVSLTGEMRPGSRLSLVSDVAPGRTFHPRISRFEPNRRMEWRDGMPLGLFQGVRNFVLTPQAAGTRFEMTEVFSGLMLPLIWRSMPDLNPGFQKFANGLKDLAERA